MPGNGGLEDGRRRIEGALETFSAAGLDGVAEALLEPLRYALSG